MFLVSNAIGHPCFFVSALAKENFEDIWVHIIVRSQLIMVIPLPPSSSLDSCISSCETYENNKNKNLYPNLVHFGDFNLPVIDNL